MNCKKLERLIRLSGKTKRLIAAESGITRQTLDNALNGQDIRVSILEGIASALNVRVGDLFDDPPAQDGDIVPPADSSPVWEQLREKDRQIAALLGIIGKPQTIPDKGIQNTAL